jgi:MscS family membrane protein
MTLENRLLTIPNNQLVDAAIENVSSEPSRKVSSVLGLTYQTSPEKMKIALDILKNISQNVPGVSKRNIVASFTEFSASSLNITFVYYIKKDADIYDTTNAANLYILKSFNDNNLDFAYQTIKIEK